MTGLSKYLHSDKLVESGIKEGFYSDTDSEEELDGSHISSEDSQQSDIDGLEWRGNVCIDIAYAHQFMEEQNEVNRTDVPHLKENLQTFYFFMLFLDRYFL